jgi:hypothetical protein
MLLSHFQPHHINLISIVDVIILLFVDTVVLVLSTMWRDKIDSNLNLLFVVVLIVCCEEVQYSMFSC